MSDKVEIKCTRSAAHKSGRDVFIGKWTRPTPAHRWTLKPRDKAAGVVELVEWSQPLTAQERITANISADAGPVFRHQVIGDAYFPYDRWRMTCRQCGTTVTLRDDNLQKLLTLQADAPTRRPLDLAKL